MSQGPWAVAALAVVVTAAEIGTAIAAAIRHAANSRVRRRILGIRDTKTSVFIRLLRHDLAGLFLAREQTSFRLMSAQDRFDRRWVTSASLGKSLISWVRVSKSARHKSADADGGLPGPQSSSAAVSLRLSKFEPIPCVDPTGCYGPGYERSMESYRGLSQPSGDARRICKFHDQSDSFGSPVAD
jgi:hypothetical protein